MNHMLIQIENISLIHLYKIRQYSAKIPGLSGQHNNSLAVFHS